MAERPATRQLERVAPLSGVAFAVVAFAAVMLWGEMVEPGQAAEAKAAHYLEDTDKVLAGAQLMGLAAFLLAWFGASLRSALARVDGLGDRFAPLAFGGTIAAAALLLAGAGANLAVALRADELGSIDAEAAAMVGDLGSVLVAAVAPIAMALVTAATGLVALRGRTLLPTGLAWVSLVLTVGLVLMPINYMVVLGFLAWTTVVGLLLYSRQPG